MTDVVIVSAARTPVGSFNGALSSLPAHELGKIAIRAAVERAGVEAAEVAERVRGYFGARAVMLASGKEIRATVSAGLAVSGEGSLPLAALLSQADAALYEAKRGGRDQVRGRPQLRAV